jgi:hypothetical protein
VRTARRTKLSGCTAGGGRSVVAYDPNASRVANRNVDGLCTRDELMVEKQRALNVKSSQVKCIMNSSEFGDIRYKPNGKAAHLECQVKSSQVYHE